MIPVKANSSKQPLFWYLTPGIPVRTEYPFLLNVPIFVLKLGEIPDLLKFIPSPPPSLILF